MPAKDPGSPAGLPPIGEGFVGRKRELDRIGGLVVGPARLVTLIGPGGIGKTRLAEEAARRMYKARRTPLWSVRLAGLPQGADTAVVREAVTAAVLMDGFVGASAWDGAVQRLSPVDAAGRVVHTMLLLDNCEHLLASGRTVIADLLDAVPGLTILATSREPIGWINEQLVTVPPLSATQSLELFRQRAELADHPITEPGQIAVAEQICGHMHGHPLCIRLAAARMFHEPLPMILKQLSGESDDMRMRWRHRPQAGLEARHQAIGDVIAWSYELCSDKQRLLFDRLSVFAPGYEINPKDTSTGAGDLGAELEAIEVVCSDDAPIQQSENPSTIARADQSTVGLARSEIRELLERLVEQSLVSVHMTANTVHHYLVESLRLFAADRLADRSTEQIDEPARLAARHCYYYRDKVVHAQTKWFSPAEQELLTWTIGAWSNIRRAIDTSLQAGEPDVGLQICLGLLSLRSLFVIGTSEIRSRIDQTLEATQTSQHQPAELQVATMALNAWLALVQGRPQDSEALFERSVAACAGDAAHGGQWRNEPESDIGLPAVVDYAWGGQLMLLRRDPRAIAVFARAGEKYHRIGDRGGEAMSELFEALTSAYFGSAERAMTICRRHLERTTAAGAGLARSWAQMALAIALTKHGDAEEALHLGREALAYQFAFGDQWGPAWAVYIRMWSLARLMSDQIASANASRSALVKVATEIAYLAGGVETHRTRLGLTKGLGPFADETRTAETIARDALGQQIYADTKSQGAQLSPERSELQRLALGTLSIPVSSAAKTAMSTWDSLSAAEQEVAILAAAGWPNSAIGVRRGTSGKTAEVQMRSIFQKLMIDSRQEIIRFVPQDQREKVLAERLHRPRRGRGKPRSIDSPPQQ